MVYLPGFLNYVYMSKFGLNTVFKWSWFISYHRKRFEHQQKFMEEERKRRQFEEQKQKLRLLSSVKPKVRYE